MGVSGGAHRDPGGQVDEPVPVDVPGLRAFAVIHDKRRGARVGGGDDSAVAVEDFPGFGSGQVVGLHRNGPPGSSFRPAVGLRQPVDPPFIGIRRSGKGVQVRSIVAWTDNYSIGAWFAVSSGVYTRVKAPSPLTSSKGAAAWTNGPGSSTMTPAFHTTSTCHPCRSTGSWRTPPRPTQTVHAPFSITVPSLTRRLTHWPPASRRPS